MITVTANIKDRFFDREKVVQQIGRANVRKLSKMGAFIQRRARTSLRRGPRRRIRGRTVPSTPGTPPRVWSRDSFATLKNILFGLSRDNNAVLIGPRIVPSRKPKGSSAQTVPELLEHGGTAMVAVDPDSGEPLGYTPKDDRNVVMRKANYSARPFMGPALQAEIAAGTVRDVWSARVA